MVIRLDLGIGAPSRGRHTPSCMSAGLGGHPFAKNYLHKLGDTSFKSSPSGYNVDIFRQPDDRINDDINHRDERPKVVQCRYLKPSFGEGEKVVSALDSEGREFDQRPWGNFTVLDDKSPNYKVKQIVVLPNKRLSYQRHSQRAEHWFILSGRATAILDGVTYELEPGQSINIGIGQAHRCENRGTEHVVFIEIQTGTYFGEDDIVRLEDDFGRR